MPVVVVARTGLGTINHTLLTLEALAARRCGRRRRDGRQAAIVENRRAIETYGRVPVVGELPPLDPLTPEALARWAASELDAGGRLQEWLRSEPDPLERPTLIERDRACVWHPYTQMLTRRTRCRSCAARASISITEDGRRLLDGISSWWVNIHGHSHPQLNEALAAQARELEHVVFANCTHRPAVELAERLVAVLPPGLTRVFYSDNGSTAVEVALKLARQYWGNRGEPARATFIALAPRLPRRHRRRDVGERGLDLHAAVRADAVRRRTRARALLLPLPARARARHVPDRVPRCRAGSCPRRSERCSSGTATRWPPCSSSRCCRGPAA